MKKCVIYARYSHGPNQTEQSIEGQLMDCSNYAKEHDLTIVKTYTDKLKLAPTRTVRLFNKCYETALKACLMLYWSGKSTALAEIARRWP